MTDYKKKLRSFCLKAAGVLFIALIIYSGASTFADFLESRMKSVYILSAGTDGSERVYKRDGFIDKMGQAADFLVGGSFTDAYSAFGTVSSGFYYDEERVSYIENMPLAKKQESGKVLEKTVSSGGGKTDAGGKITINNETSYGGFSENSDPAFKVENEGVQVIIVHTHTTESYAPTEKFSFSHTSEDRSTNSDYNMLRIGKELKKELENRGISCRHITDVFDYPEYNNSYARSCKAVEQALSDSPRTKIVLDLHRDSIINSEGVKTKLTTNINGEKVAQVMLVVGTDELGLKHDGWRTNLHFATHFQKFLLAEEENFARPINLRTSRFNGHTAPGAVIVEVGTGANTIEEALASTKYIANAVKNVIESYK